MILGNDNISYHTTSAGLRCVHIHDGESVEYCGLAVDAGSRDEMPGEEGLAHFVEHTVFKGTSRRRSYHIINRMESCGGELNAFTTKETTVVYSVFPAGNLDRASELIADIVVDSQFPEPEIAREREVVLDEVASYLDMPSEAVYDDFEDLMFAGSQLGHNILGTRESVARFSSVDCRRFLNRYYTAPNMVFFYLGPEKPEKVFKIAERRFSSLSSEPAPLHRVSPDVVERFTRESGGGESHQAHTVAGCRLPGLNDPLNPSIQLLVNHIGGFGMNSLLNVQLRERRGLVYAVEASSTRYTDCGELTIYMGCDHDDKARCRKIVERVLDKLCSDGVTGRELAAMKRQFLGQMAIGGENRENVAIGAGRRMLHFPSLLTDSEARALIDDIDCENIRQAASLMSAASLSWLTLS